MYGTLPQAYEKHQCEAYSIIYYYAPVAPSSELILSCVEGNFLSGSAPRVVLKETGNLGLRERRTAQNTRRKGLVQSRTVSYLMVHVSS